MIKKKRPMMNVYNHGTDGINLSHLAFAPIELLPLEFHRKEDGAVGDKPSFAIVLLDPVGKRLYVAQMSEATLFDAIEHSM